MTLEQKIALKRADLATTERDIEQLRAWLDANFFSVAGHNEAAARMERLRNQRTQHTRDLEQLQAQALAT